MKRSKLLRRYYALTSRQLAKGYHKSSNPKKPHLIRAARILFAIRNRVPIGWVYFDPEERRGNPIKIR